MILSSIFLGSGRQRLPVISVPGISVHDNLGPRQSWSGNLIPLNTLELV